MVEKKLPEKEPPKIEFPCEDYLIKVLGVAHEEMFEFVLETTEQFSPGFNRDKTTLKASGKGRFQSVTVYITATDLEQLQAYHRTLMAHPYIKMVI